MSNPNEIVTENQLPGDPNWDISSPDSSIEGFTTDISTNIGNTVSFKINTDAKNYSIEIYRLGYYGGAGARLVTTIQHQGTAAPMQPSALTDPSTGMVDAGNWSVTDTWAIPPSSVSGVYVAKLIRNDGSSVGSGVNQIPFVVRDDSRQSDIVFQTSDATWEAYNSWGGQNLYDGTSDAVSYNRPITTRWTKPDSSLFGAEYPAIYWLEENGYDVSYLTNADTARNGTLLLNHKAFLSVGHDEYWSAEQFNNVQAAANSGVNLAFMSGNEIYWKTQWAPSIDASGTPFRSVITYKTSQTGLANPSGVWTGTWRDPAGLSQGGIPENLLTGQLYMVNDPGSTAPITVPYAQSQLRFWRNTSVAALQPGQIASLIPDMLAYEFDETVDNGFQPAGLIDLSSTTVPVSTLLQDAAGTQYGPGTATANLTLYRNSSGAMVFNAGTVFWTWGLSTKHDSKGGVVSPPTADPNVQQATVNLFADMGIQPGALDASLQLASKSTDTLPPISVITSFDFAGGLVNVHGTASDLGGGMVAGVEVSGDGGATWHQASGTTNWTFSEPQFAVEGTLISRAVDDSVNLENNRTLYTNDISFRGYFSANPDVAASGLNGALHYDEYGWREGRNPNSNFDTLLYLLHNPDVASAGVDPYQEYIQTGLAQGRETYPAIGHDFLYQIVSDFDPEYYLLSNPDVGASGMDPFQHYITYGWKEGRNPNAYFDTKSYLSANPDVAASGLDPLYHYDTYGWKEGRNPSGLFNTIAYLSANPDVAASGLDPLQHFLQYGAFELRAPQGTGSIA